MAEAAQNMNRAASSMNDAANRIVNAVDNFNLFQARLDNTVARFEAAAQVYSDAVERLILDGPNA
jgi:ABC-type transporter Mla subunit MlaD